MKTGQGPIHTIDFIQSLVLVMIQNDNMSDVDIVLPILLDAFGMFVAKRTPPSSINEGSDVVVTTFWTRHLEEILYQAGQCFDHESGAWRVLWAPFRPSFVKYSQSVVDDLYSLDELLLSNFHKRSDFNVMNPSAQNISRPIAQLAVILLQLGLALFLLEKRPCSKRRAEELSKIKSTNVDILSRMKKDRGQSFNELKRMTRTWFETSLITAVKAHMLDNYQNWLRNVSFQHAIKIEQEKKELEKKLQAMKEELHQTKQQRENLSRERNELQRKLQNLQDTNQHLQVRLQDNDKKLTQQKLGIEQLSSKNKKLEKELKEKCKTLDTTVAENTEVVSTLKSTLRELRNENEASESERERLQVALQAAHEVQARVRSEGVIEFQKDEVIPSLSELEAMTLSAHSLIALPLTREFQKAGQLNPDDRVADIVRKSFEIIKRRYDARIVGAAKQLYKRDMQECSDIRRIFLSAIVGSSDYARQCRYDLFDGRHLLLITDGRLRHRDRCKQLFGNESIEQSMTKEGERHDFCCCDLVHFSALLVIYNFELLFLTHETISDATLKYFDIINVPQSGREPPGFSYTYKTIWPAIRMPATGRIVNGKAEVIPCPIANVAKDWTQILSPPSYGEGNPRA